MKFSFVLLDTETGKTIVVEGEHDSFDGMRYMWTDGNYSCDCNRGDHFDKDLPCNMMENMIRLVDVLDADGVSTGIRDRVMEDA